MDNNLSPADISALTGNGMGGGWEGLIFLFAILALFNGGGFGFGNNGLANAIGYENLATSNEVQRGFDNQNLQAQTRDILSAVNAGTAQSIATTNQTFHDSLMANQNLYNEIARDISNVQMAQANTLANQNACCCDTKMLIQQTNAETNANLTAQIQSVKDMIAQNKIEALQAQVSQLQLAQATNGMLKFPNSWSYGAGAFPPICGCNNI